MHYTELPPLHEEFPLDKGTETDLNSVPFEELCSVFENTTTAVYSPREEAIKALRKDFPGIEVFPIEGLEKQINLPNDQPGQVFHVVREPLNNTVWMVFTVSPQYQHIAGFVNFRFEAWCPWTCTCIGVFYISDTEVDRKVIDEHYENVVNAVSQIPPQFVLLNYPVDEDDWWNEHADETAALFGLSAEDEEFMVEVEDTAKSLIQVYKRGTTP